MAGSHCAGIWMARWFIRTLAGKLMREEEHRREGRASLSREKLEREWGKENEGINRGTPIYNQYRTGPIHFNHTG